MGHYLNENHWMAAFGEDAGNRLRWECCASVPRSCAPSQCSTAVGSQGPQKLSDFWNGLHPLKVGVAGSYESPGRVQKLLGGNQPLPNFWIVPMRRLWSRLLPTRPINTVLRRAHFLCQFRRNVPPWRNRKARFKMPTRPDFGHLHCLLPERETARLMQFFQC